jgi:hypothetical protein
MKTASRDQDYARQELELHDQHPARSPLRSPLGMHPTDGFVASQRESVFQPRSHTPPTPFRATPESTSQSNMAANAKKQKRKSGIRGAKTVEANHWSVHRSAIRSVTKSLRAEGIAITTAYVMTTDSVMSYTLILLRTLACCRRHRQHHSNLQRRAHSGYQI